MRRAVALASLGYLLWCPAVHACPWTVRDRQAFERDGWESLRLTRELRAADWTALGEDCRRLAGSLRKRAARFLDRQAAFVRVSLPPRTLGLGAGVVVSLDGEPLGEAAQGLPPGMPLRPGRHDLALQVLRPEGGRTVVSRVLVNGEPVEPRGEASHRYSFELDVGKHEISVDVAVVEARCFLVRSAELHVSASLRESAPTVVLHGAGTSRPLQAPMRLASDLYALEVVRGAGAGREAHVEVFVDGTRLKKRGVLGSGVRHLWRATCELDSPREASLVVNVRDALVGDDSSGDRVGGSARGLSTLAWVGAGIGVVGLGVATASHFAFQRPAEDDAARLVEANGCGDSEQTSTCSDEVVREINQRSDDAASAAAIANLGLAGLGVGAVVAGVAWYLGRDETPPPAVGLQFGPLLGQAQLGLWATGVF